MTSNLIAEPNQFPEYVIDEEGYKHFLIEKLGQGGQGAVFKTKDENVVIKVVLDQNGKVVHDPDQYDAYKDEIDEVRILNLPENIHIAKPVHMLKRPMNGYIMRLLSDMVPIKKMMIVPKEEGLKAFYIKTGGLKRRLELLAKIAKILARIHSLPVVYGDISPDNIYISKNLDASEVWLIDADNMRYTIDFKSLIYTPGFGAPEIRKQLSSNNTLSDVYSFAILAFELLSHIPPFEGEMLLNEGGWDEDNWDDEDDWDDDESTVDNYEKAELGEIPWVYDEDDRRNFNDNGIPREIILSKGLRKLFQQTFGEQGRMNPSSRPTMKQWYETLQQAADATITCPHCSGSYYIGNNVCPFCDTTRDSVYLGQIFDEYVIEKIIDETVETGEKSELKLNYEEMKDIRFRKRGFKIIENKPGSLFLYNYHTDDTLIRDELEETIEIQIGKITSIKNLMGNDIFVVRNNEGVRLKKFDIMDYSDLDQVAIQISIDDYKVRNIFFQLM